MRNNCQGFYPGTLMLFAFPEGAIDFGYSGVPLGRVLIFQILE